MKNTIKNLATIAVFSLTILGSTFASSDIKASDIKTFLPVSLPVIETPAPTKTKKIEVAREMTPVQKASIVGLELKSLKK